MTDKPKATEIRPPACRCRHSGSEASTKTTEETEETEATEASRVILREIVSREKFGQALRLYRNLSGMTQAQLSQRAEPFNSLGFGRLLESQISDFERGKAFPGMSSFLNFLAAGSADGKTIDLDGFCRALSLVLGTDKEFKVVPSASSLESRLSRLEELMEVVLRERVGRWVWMSHVDHLMDVETEERSDHDQPQITRTSTMVQTDEKAEESV